jgi:peptide maturation system protein (TIGR04066 family)
MEKLRVCAVSFGSKDIPVILNLTEFLPEYMISSVVTPSGIGLENKDIGVIENRNDLGYLVTSNLEESIQSCDIVLVLEKEVSTPLYEYGIKAMEEAVHQEKDIICLLKLTKETQRQYEEICRKKNISFRCSLPDKLPPNSPKETTESFYHPYAPVIFIGELAEEVQGFEVFCNLVKRFQAVGIKVSAIAAEAANSLFGLHTIDFSDTKGELGSRIYRINHYIRELEERENPELIIIKLPKPMIKFDEDVRYDFGLSAYMIAQAISASYFIVCSPYGFFADEFWEPLSNNFEAKFGYGIDAIHISNKVIDNTNEMDKDKLNFVHLPAWKAQEAILQVTGETSILLGDFTDLHQLEKVADEINSTLLQAPYGLIL